jgi:hypothetical protein
MGKFVGLAGLKTGADGVQAVGGADKDGIPWWKAADREHPVGIEGVIASVDERPNTYSKYEWDKTQTVIVVKTPEHGEAWRIGGGPRDLRNKFRALADEGKLVPGMEFAAKFVGKRNETAKDGSTYQVDSYAVAVGDLVEVPVITGKNADGTPQWSTDPQDLR